jgi:hypothetical protein
MSELANAELVAELVYISDGTKLPSMSQPGRRSHCLRLPCLVTHIANWLSRKMVGLRW